MLPFSNQRRYSQDDSGEIDPESNQLIPTRKRRHRVRVQGRLAVVRSVSTVNLRPAASVPPALPSPVGTSGTTTPATPKFESGVAGSTVAPVRRRRSFDDGSSGTEEEDDVKETAVRDRQFRGYGIGGAGNISELKSLFAVFARPADGVLHPQDGRLRFTDRRNLALRYRSFPYSTPPGHQTNPIKGHGASEICLGEQGIARARESMRNDLNQTLLRITPNGDRCSCSIAFWMDTARHNLAFWGAAKIISIEN